MSTIEPWVYVVEHGTLNRLWVRQDGLGNWLVTQQFYSHPEYYLTIDGNWTDRVTPDARHDVRSAKSLALGIVMARAAGGEG